MRPFNCSQRLVELIIPDDTQIMMKRTGPDEFGRHLRRRKLRAEERIVLDQREKERIAETCDFAEEIGRRVRI